MSAPHAAAIPVTFFLPRMWVEEALFWLHFAIIAGGLLMGLVLPWQLAVAAVSLHRVHLWIFGGCILSKFQSKKAGLKEDFLQQMVRRFFSLELAEHHVKWVDRTIALASIAVALVHATLGAAWVWQLAILATVFFGIFTCWRLYKAKRQPSGTGCSEGVCSVVLESKFNAILGVPLEVIGAGFFAILLVAWCLSIISGGLHIIFLGLLVLGVLGATACIFLQTSILKQFCQLCMNVHGSLFTIAAFSVCAIF